MLKKGIRYPFIRWVSVDRRIDANYVDDSLLFWYDAWAKLMAKFSTSMQFMCIVWGYSEFGFSSWFVLLEGVRYQRTNLSRQ